MYMATDVHVPQTTGEASEPAGNCLMGNLGWMLDQANHALGSEIAGALAPLGETHTYGADQAVLVQVKDDPGTLCARRRQRSPAEGRLKVVGMENPGAASPYGGGDR